MIYIDDLAPSSNYFAWSSQNSDKFKGVDISQLIKLGRVTLGRSTDKQTSNVFGFQPSSSSSKIEFASLRFEYNKIIFNCYCSKESESKALIEMYKNKDLNRDIFFTASEDSEPNKPNMNEDSIKIESHPNANVSYDED